jgi:uncharacterized membrane protein YbhN (UPF0104 family)
LSRYSTTEIIRGLSQYRADYLFLVVLLSLATYVALAGYDYLAFRYLRKSVPLRHVVLTAFVAFAMGNNIGMANFAGAAVRYRMYSAFGVPGIVVTEAVALNVLSNWLGFLLTAGLVFCIADPSIPLHWHVPIHHSWPIGAFLLLILAAYFVFALIQREPLQLGRWKIPVPCERIFFLQVVVGSVDFLSGAWLCYLLLPRPLTLEFLPFLGKFMLALFAGVLSHVPGGLGVFESAMIFLLAPDIPGPSLISALLAFRIIYFIFPLVVSLPMFLGFEIRQKRRRLTA